MSRILNFWTFSYWLLTYGVGNTGTQVFNLILFRSKTVADVSVVTQLSIKSKEIFRRKVKSDIFHIKNTIVVFSWFTILLSIYHLFMNFMANMSMCYFICIWRPCLSFFSWLLHSSCTEQCSLAVTGMPVGRVLKPIWIVLVWFYYTYLPSATTVAESYVFTGVCRSTGGCTSPWADTPPGQTHTPLASHPHGQTPLWPDTPPSRHLPPGRWPLQQMVCILLECILVLYSYHLKGSAER